MRDEGALGGLGLALIPRRAWQRNQSGISSAPIRTVRSTELLADPLATCLPQWIPHSPAHGGNKCESFAPNPPLSQGIPSSPSTPPLPQPPGVGGAPDPSWAEVCGQSLQGARGKSLPWSELGKPS